MKRLICFGDSITGPHPETRYLEHYLKWSDLLQLALETHLGVGAVEVLNRGWAGSNSTQAVARLDKDVLAVHPDVVVILIGGNDFDPAAEREGRAVEFERNLTTIVRRMKEEGTRVLLLQYAEPRSDDMTKVWTHLNAGNGIISEVGNREGIPILSLETGFAEAAKTHPLAELINRIDGVHLNPYGEIVVARSVFFKLRELGWLTP